MSIRLENVTYIYNQGTIWEKAALRDVSIFIEKGDCVGIVGRAGSGKSTLLQVLNGILIPQKGRIFLDDVEVTGLSADKMACIIRRKTGLVFQFPEEQFFASTVYEEIAFALRNIGLKGTEMEKRVKRAMESAGLDYEVFKDRFPYTLSSGEKRRLGLATILALEPQYLLLDEPTAALDYEGRETVYRIIKEVNRNINTTVIIVAHNLEHLVNICNRIIVLEAGRIALNLKVEELAAFYEELVRLGVYPPFHHQVIYHLQKRGYDINIYLKTREEAAREIEKIFPVFLARRKGAGV